MAKYCWSDDVYNDIVGVSGENWLLGLLAFAIVEEQRIDWAKHRRAVAGASPTVEEIHAWYESQPQSVINRARVEAEAALKRYASRALEQFSEQHRNEIARGVIVAEMRKIGHWGRQLAMNALGGFIGSLLFTALLMLVALFVLNEPSPNEIVRTLKQQTQEERHGDVGMGSQAR